MPAPALPARRRLAHALRLSRQLFERGINVQPIVFPGVAHPQARLRFFFCSEHTEAEIDALISAVAAGLAQLD